MSSYKTQRCFPYPWEDVFNLVAAIRQYPAFVPGVAAMRVWDECVGADGGRLKAEFLVRYKVFTERFSTHVVLDKAARRIETSLIHGPFRRLENVWRFESLEDGSTNIHFSIEYQFKNPVLQMLLSQNFARATKAVLAAFEKRAKATMTPVHDMEKS